MRVKETKKLTPVGGMLKETAPIEEVQVAEKLILSSDKLRELLYLPAYLLPKATDFSRKLLKYFFSIFKKSNQSFKLFTGSKRAFSAQRRAQKR